MVANSGCQLFSQPKVKQDELQLPPYCLCCHLCRELATVCPPYQYISRVKVPTGQEIIKLVH